MAAYLAKPYAQSVTAILDGPDGMETTDLHLQKARALLVVFRGSVGEAIQTLAPGFAVAVRKRSQSLVDLDTRVDTLLIQAVDESLTILGGLVEGLFKENGTTNVLTKVRGRDE